MAQPSTNVLTYVETEDLAAEQAGLSSPERRVVEAVNQKIAARESVRDVVDFLFEQTQDLTPCDRIGVAVIEDDGGRVRSYYNRAAYEPLVLPAGYAEDLRGSSLEEVISRGVPRLIHDLEAYLAHKPESNSTRALVREGVRSSMTCPLAVDGRNVGLLFRSSRRPQAYGAREVALHSTVAERLSQAFEKTWLIEQLRQANESYMELLGFVSHELKAPVASILQNVQLFVDGYLGEISKLQRERLARMAVKGEYLLGIVKEYLDLARLEGGALEPKLAPVDLVADVIEAALDIVGPQLEERAMRVEREWSDEPIRIHADRDLLRIVLVNLLSNAAKYGRESGRVVVRAASDPERTRVAVWNEGPGFPAEQRGRLFRKFSRLDTPELRQAKGTGVGLYTAWRIVQLHDGHIDAASEPGHWAEFAFVLPRAQAEVDDSPLEAQP